MPKYVYSYKSPVGTFWIRQERDKSWSLSIGDEGIIEVIGYWDSAFEAADSVFMKTTGWDSWDRRLKQEAPAFLDGWTKRLVR
jgi:hypothetical protein